MKLIKGALLFALIFLISVSLTSGLELSASTVGNDGNSATHVVYGSTIDDYANEHIGLNPGDATLSNSFSGSGSLPSSSIAKVTQRVTTSVFPGAFPENLELRHGTTIGAPTRRLHLRRVLVLGQR